MLDHYPLNVKHGSKSDLAGHAHDDRIAVLDQSPPVCYGKKRVQGFLTHRGVQREEGEMHTNSRFFFLFVCLALATAANAKIDNNPLAGFEFDEAIGKHARSNPYLAWRWDATPGERMQKFVFDHGKDVVNPLTKTHYVLGFSPEQATEWNALTTTDPRAADMRILAYSQFSGRADHTPATVTVLDRAAGLFTMHPAVHGGGMSAGHGRALALIQSLEHANPQGVTARDLQTTMKTFHGYYNGDYGMNAPTAQTFTRYTVEGKLDPARFDWAFKQVEDEWKISSFDWQHPLDAKHFARDLAFEMSHQDGALSHLDKRTLTGLVHWFSGGKDSVDRQSLQEFLWAARAVKYNGTKEIPIELGKVLEIHQAVLNFKGKGCPTLTDTLEQVNINKGSRFPRVQAEVQALKGNTAAIIGMKRTCTIQLLRAMCSLCNQTPQEPICQAKAGGPAFPQDPAQCKLLDDMPRGFRKTNWGLQQVTKVGKAGAACPIGPEPPLTTDVQPVFQSGPGLSTDEASNADQSPTEFLSEQTGAN